MGDAPPQRQSSQDNFRSNPNDTSSHSLATTNLLHKPSPNMDIEGYLPHHFSGSGPSPGPPAMDMRSLAGALPDFSARAYPQQSFQHIGIPGAHSQGVVYQLPPGAQFAGQAGGAQQFPQHYNQSQQSRPGAFSNFVGASSAGGQPQSFHSPGQQTMVPGHPHMQQFLHPQPPTHYGANFATRGYQQPLRINPTAHSIYQNPGQHSVTRTSSNSSMQAASSSVLRGPPRKPKQSGHALWVGNLPPGTHIIDLKDHFSRDATNDIESVFLISKSNCAFVNYKTEESCQAAMSRFHDSRFQNVRLVCRLRRGSSSSTPATSQIPLPTDTNTDTQNVEVDTSLDSASPGMQPPASQEKVKEKYFVVKSLTAEDLERSVQSGVWATQAHNEAALSKAYESAEDVFLIFSANKSGEYFGYARMESAIGDEEAAAKTEIPSASSTDPATSISANDPQSASTTASLVDVPVTIATPPTATAPRGRIIDDSSRGTIFWEADPIDSPSSMTPDPNADPAISLTPDHDPSASQSSGNVSAGEAGYDSSALSASPGTPQQQTTFGKPFRISWVSTDRLPFYRTRGLRNPWNANREVKIARDGTEIEPSVGRRLVSMFGMAFPPPQQGHQGMPVGVMPGGGRGMMPIGAHHMGAAMYLGHGGNPGMMGPAPRHGSGQGGYGKGY